MYASKRSVVVGLPLLLCALSAYSQSGAVAVDSADQPGDERMPLIRDGGLTLPNLDYSAQEGSRRDEGQHQMFDSNAHGDPIKSQPLRERLRSRPADFNREIYYRNKLEFSLEGGWLPINVPFPLDIFVGDAYNSYPLKYTLVPIFASLRWQMGDLRGPVILRGNWDLTLTGSVTAVPRGPENHYYSYIMGIRRNFVPRNSRIAPYFDVRLGVGRIDAKGPKGILYAQGQDLTFTMNMGSGVRYNFNPRYSISAGLNFMHISNLDLSESNGKPNWGFRNYGINVYGPMVGIDIQLRRHQHSTH
jgi:hypothetical protein